MAGGFVSHPGRGKLAEFLINQREQFVGGHGVALLSAIEDAGDIAHRVITLPAASLRYAVARTTPPSTRRAAPFVALASGEQV